MKILPEGQQLKKFGFVSHQILFRYIPAKKEDFLADLDSACFSEELWTAVDLEFQVEPATFPYVALAWCPL